MIPRIAEILDRYAAFGNKASGGQGDNECGEWIANDLAGMGYAIGRQSFDIGWFESDRSTLTVEGQSFRLLAQSDAAVDITAPLVWDGDPSAVYKESLVIHELPYARWSSLADRRIAAALTRLAAHDPAGVVIVANGPTGEALALNRPGHVENPLPIVTMAPTDASLLGRAPQIARLCISGSGGKRRAFNLIARLDRGAEKDIVISTPRSGWFGCVGERGPGLAIWMVLAAWLAETADAVNITMLCSSGHERGHAGMEMFLAEGAPSPATTALWLHLGANCATLDWHEADGRLAPLSSADPQRFLLASEPLLDIARSSFAGLAGLQDPYPLTDNGAGEIADVAKGGYANAAGIFGAHRFHHAISDDSRTVSPKLVEQVLKSAQIFTKGAIVNY